MDIRIDVLNAKFQKVFSCTINVPGPEPCYLSVSITDDGEVYMRNSDRPRRVTAEQTDVEAVVDITVITVDHLFVAHRDGLRTYHIGSAVDLGNMDWEDFPRSFMDNKMPYLLPQQLFDANSDEALFFFYNEYTNRPCPILRVSRETYQKRCAALERFCSIVDNELDKCACCLTDLKLLVLREKQLVELNECKHVFCKDCVLKLKDKKCPLCQQSFSGFSHSEEKTSVARMLISLHQRGWKRSRIDI